MAAGPEVPGMALTAEEQRLWRELAAELGHDRRLAAHAVGFGAIIRLRRNMALARTGAAIPPLIWMPAIVGGCLGLGLLVAGALGRSSVLSTAGTAAVVIILILAGTAMLVIGIAGCRNVPGGNVTVRDVTGGDVSDGDVSDGDDRA